MKLEKIDSLEEREKELTEGQKTSLFENIIRGKDVTDSISTSRGNFKIRFPRTRDLEAIGRVLAYRLNGLSVQSMDPDVYNLMQQIATLDVIVISGPAWYENAKKEGVFNTWGDVPVQSFVQEVYSKAYTFRIEVQKILEQDENNADTEVASDKCADNADSAGLFEGLSSSSSGTNG